MAFASVVLVGCVSPETGTYAPPPTATLGAPPRTTPSTAPSATPATARNPKILWSEHPFDGQVNAVTVDGSQLVAVGRTADGSIAVWTSKDAMTWARHAVPQSRTLTEYQQGVLHDGSEGMGPLARLGDTLFSFGTFGAYDGDVVQPVGWRSADGTAWESIESENAFFDEGGAIRQLVAGDGSLLALTVRPVVDHGGGIWLWTAATSWVQPTPVDVFSETGGAEILDAVWAEEKFVAVGMAASHEPAHSWASSWVSTDGRSWQAARPSADREEAVMYALSPMPGGGFVAVGCEACTFYGVGTPAAWVSPDGLSWTHVALPADFEGAAYAVLQLGSGLLAIGDAPDGTATWTSADGISWQAGPTLDNASHGRFVSFPDQVHNIAARERDVIFLLYRGQDEFGVPLESLLLRGIVQP
jgi:hypothetical protein